MVLDIGGGGVELKDGMERKCFPECVFLCTVSSARLILLITLLSPQFLILLSALWPLNEEILAPLLQGFLGVQQGLGVGG